MRRDLAGEDVVRLILDGTVVRARLDRKATNISLLVVLGVRRDGQKILLAVRNMGGESEAAWRGVLDDLIARGDKCDRTAARRVQAPHQDANCSAISGDRRNVVLGAACLIDLAA